MCSYIGRDYGEKIRTIRVSVSEAIRDCNGSAHNRFCYAGFRAMPLSV